MVQGKKLAFLLALFAILISACAPSDIPRDAERSWSIKSDFTWSWYRNFEQGCIAWAAKEAWAVVFVFIETKCDNSDEPAFLKDKKGLSYSSSSDFLVFRGYWPWSSKIYSDLILFDDDGMVAGVLPCPYSLPQARIDELRTVVTAAFSANPTDGERRMLLRIDELLAATDGEQLNSSQSGCSDLPLKREELLARGKVNPWAEN